MRLKQYGDMRAKIWPRGLELGRVRVREVAYGNQG